MTSITDLSTRRFQLCSQRSGNNTPGLSGAKYDNLGLKWGKVAIFMDDNLPLGV